MSIIIWCGVIVIGFVSFCLCVNSARLSRKEEKEMIERYIKYKAMVSPCNRCMAPSFNLDDCRSCKHNV